MFRALARPALLLAALAAVSGCSASNRLGEVALPGRRVAVAAAIPPAPRVQAGSPLEAGVNPWDPVGTAVRRETSEAKRRQAVRAQARLDSVVARVDVADRIARRTLARTAQALGFAPADRPADADFVLDLRVRDYGLVADSFEGDTFFVLVGEALFLDAQTGAELWRTDLDEREVVDRTVFRLPAIPGNVVTGRALAALSSGEMAAGLQRLGDLAAERIAARLVRDYERSR
ncbi:hypothetical protein RQM47_03090 [Rubrivirga sp. S365]|uniref:Lipoprotein n=1 Tax=Rubrivirga litoralis TaxID=3075598 RepID=A0ABU3BQU9_9BACT|nr:MULTISPECIES: hypothetical protein [unclassified Rubrivirga]MDT0631640.1 hypothetical protein [Rubrivirga sp. F394]MDT7855617.1 hypothetical protein [Rubrivirga sp. S365]